MTRPKQAVTGDLFASERTGRAAPEGLVYAAEVLSPPVERSFVAAFEKLPFKPFEFHGHLGNRRIVSFGYRYDYAGRTLRKVEAIPEFLSPLVSVASQFSGVPEASLQQALVTEYAPGAGIGWHRDKPMFDKVIAMSFLAPCVLRLRRRQGSKWERRAVAVAPRSAYLLSGQVREEWEHSILPMERLRYSVTFRTFRPSADRP